jgi:hypothetical protein
MQSTAVKPLPHAAPVPADECALVRGLAARYLELCADPDQARRRKAWARLNSLRGEPPLIYVRAFAWHEMPESRLRCRHPLLRPIENFFRESLFRSTFDDDFIFEPWVTMPAVHRLPPGGLWGVSAAWTRPSEEHGAGVWDAPIKEEEDLEKVRPAPHDIDEEATLKKEALLREALGDAIPVAVDRGPLFRMWEADLSNPLSKLRGLEQVMIDLSERPEWLGMLMDRLRDGVLSAQAAAERAGHLRLIHHENQSMRYSEELPWPSRAGEAVSRKDLWCFCASQEWTGVGPGMFEEFLVSRQRPILEHYGQVAYGCCEDLSRKIGVLSKIPNLRRIAVSPMADVAACAEQIGDRWVLSYRPSPADMVSYGWSPERVRSILSRDLAHCRKGHVEISLKDVETVQGDPQRIRSWVKLARQVIDKTWK